LQKGEEVIDISMSVVIIRLETIGKEVTQRQIMLGTRPSEPLQLDL
jgi:hypothetical protein